MHRNENSYSEIFSDKKYKLVVLDMDGTLYYQRAMQLFMCMEMGMFAIRHPFSIWKLGVISTFRKIREMQEFEKLNQCHIESRESGADLLSIQYMAVAKKTGRSQETVKEIIEEWMFLRPLKYLGFTSDKRLCEWIKQWKSEGKKVIIYSDYPLKDKCAMLKISADGMYFSGDVKIGEMKPSVKGLDIICSDFSVEKNEVLIIGDRKSKDGKMAESADVDFVILKKWKLMRNNKY